MVYCKKFIILFLILFILLFNFSSVFASEVEDVSYNSVSGLAFNSSGNYFFESSSSSVGYFELEKGYIYHITLASGSTHYLALSNEVPGVNIPFTFLSTIEAGETYNFLSQNNDYLYFNFRNATNITITREKVVGQESAIYDLVSNVGPNALWSIFGNTTSYILIVVSVALGLFLLVCAIRSISKTKSKF